MRADSRLRPTPTARVDRSDESGHQDRNETFRSHQRLDATANDSGTLVHDDTRRFGRRDPPPAVTPLSSDQRRTCAAGSRSASGTAGLPRAPASGLPPRMSSRSPRSMWNTTSLKPMPRSFLSFAFFASLQAKYHDVCPTGTHWHRRSVPKRGPTTILEHPTPGKFPMTKRA